jgi:hypothetical protein
MGLQVSLREAGEVTIIDLAGDLVFPDCAELHLEVKKLLQAGTRRVALNLEKVEGVDQHGLGTLSACFVSVLRESTTQRKTCSATWSRTNVNRKAFPSSINSARLSVLPCGPLWLWS